MNGQIAAPNWQQMWKAPTRTTCRRRGERLAVQSVTVGNTATVSAVTSGWRTWRDRDADEADEDNVGRDVLDRPGHAGEKDTAWGISAQLAMASHQLVRAHWQGSAAAHRNAPRLYTQTPRQTPSHAVAGNKAMRPTARPSASAVTE